MANDIDLSVGISDMATKALDNLQAKVRSMSERSQATIATLSDSGVASFRKMSESVAKQGIISPQAVAQLETAINNIGNKIDAAVVKTNASIESVSSRVQKTIASISSFIQTAARIATVGAAFAVVSRSVFGLGASLGLIPGRLQNVVNKANETGKGVTGVVGSFAKYTIAAGATVGLATNMGRLTSSTTGAIGKLTALGGAAVNAFVLKNAFKKAEDGSTTLVTKIAKVAGTAIAFGIVTKATVNFGFSLLGLKKKTDDLNTSLAKTSVAAKSIDGLKTASMAAVAPIGMLAQKMDDLPKGASSIASAAASVQSFASQFGILGAIVGVPAAIAGGFVAITAAAGKTQLQISQMTMKLKLVEAAANNVDIDTIDPAPLRKTAEEAEKTARSIQNVTNIAASKLMTLATSNLARGLDPTQMGDAMKSAAGLAEVFGTSLEEGMSKTRAAMDGNFEAFERLIPSIATMATNEEKLAAVSRLAANGLKVMQFESSGLWGTVDRLKNGFGNLLSDIGQGKNITELFATVLRDIVAPAVKYVDTQLKGFGFDGAAIMNAATQMAAGIVAAIQTVGSNWNTITERMKLTAELLWVQITDGAKFFATNTMPWVGRSLVTMMSNAWDIVVGKTQSSFQLMTTASMEYMGLVAKGTTDFQKAEFDRANKRTLMQGVSAAPQRQAGERERALQEQIKQLDGKLASAFNQNYQRAFTDLQSALDKQQQATNIKLKPTEAAKKKEEEQPKVNMKTQARQSDAFESRILTRGPSRDPQVEMVQVLKQINSYQLKMYLAAKENERKQLATKPKLDIEIVGGAG